MVVQGRGGGCGHESAASPRRMEAGMGIVLPSESAAKLSSQTPRVSIFWSRLRMKRAPCDVASSSRILPHGAEVAEEPRVEEADVARLELAQLYALRLAQPQQLAHAEELDARALEVLEVHGVVDDGVAVRVGDEHLDRQPVLPVLNGVGVGGGCRPHPVVARLRLRLRLGVELA